MLDEIVDTGSDFDVRFRDGSSMPVDYDATVAQLLEQMRIRREATAWGVTRGHLHPLLLLWRHLISDSVRDRLAVAAPNSADYWRVCMSEFSELSLLLDDIVDTGSNFEVRFRDGSSMPVDYVDGDEFDILVTDLLKLIKTRREAILKAWRAPAL